jgi:thiol-disulfide isomerase/thioredoxin
MKIYLFFLLLITLISSQKLIEINADDLHKIIKDSKNKLVLVNFWATWCSPCKKEMPDLLKLQDKYKKNFTLVLVSLDFIEEKNKAHEFMKSLEVPFDTYLNTEEINSFLEKMPESWTGAIPFTVLYNGRNEQVLETVLGETSFKTFEHILKKHF